MANAKLRQAIAHEAARLMYERVESEYYTAKWKAAKRLCPQRCKPEDLPSNAEIRQLVQTFAHLYEGDRRTENLRDMRLAALKLMRILRRFKPRLIGSVMTGHVRQGSDIDLHVFSDTVSPITDTLEYEGLRYDLERKQVRKHDETRVFTHIHVSDRFDFELTVYAEDQAHYVFTSSITGKGIERASIAELEQLIEREYPDVNLEALDEPAGPVDDPYPVFRMLLLPLESVKQKSEYHPEGDALYHSLQVFALAKDHRPYDVEFLQAALLHDIGKAIDRNDHVTAGLRTLDGLITERTQFLVANHMAAHEYREGSLAPRKRDRLKESPDFDDLLLLSELDRAGRVAGAQVGTLDEALAYIKAMEEENG
ncbi:MAG: tRNA adenylyltransferase [Gemmataceae bacterium]